MTVSSLAPYLKQKFFDNNGLPLANGTLTTLSAGTTTPIATYLDSTGSTTNTNPIVLNARGECDLWLLPNVGYKFVLKDSLGNTIWTEDNVFNASLTTLYGGVDTGAVNAYILNFTAPFQSLANGIVIYWIPANTNTGPSTLNVNGLGVVPILNQSGNALSAGQIVQGGVTAVIYFNGNWLLTSSTGSIPQSGSFTITCTDPAQTTTATYSTSGSNVNINIPEIVGLSTTTTFSLSGLPTVLQPLTTKAVNVPAGFNNTVPISTIAAVITQSSGIITFYNNGLVGGWTASGTKGIGLTNGTSHIGITLAYNLL